MATPNPSVGDESADAVIRLRRNRNIRRTAASTIILRLVGALSAFVMFPVVLHHLGAQGFGIWATITSFTALFAFADLGIGNGIVSKLSSAYGRNDDSMAGRLVSSALAITTSTAVALLLIGTIGILAVNWAGILDAKHELGAREVQKALLWFLVGFTTSIPATLLYRVQVSTQQGHVAALWQIVGVVLSLVSVLLCVRLKGSLSTIVMSQTFPVALVGAANWMHFVSLKARFPIRISFQAVNKEDSIALLRTGLLFFAMQLSMALAFSSDMSLISYLRGAEAVAGYAIAAKLFSVTSILLAAYSQSLWPAYSEALARGDALWIRKSLNKSLVAMPLVAIFFSSILIICWNPLTTLWLGSPYVVSGYLLAAFTAWVAVEAVGHAYSALFNGLNVVRFQLVLAVVFGAASFIGMWLAIGSFGPIGAIAARLFCYVTIVITAYVAYHQSSRLV